MKNSLNIGKALDKAEQKEIYGGKGGCTHDAQCISNLFPNARCYRGNCVYLG